MCNPSQGFYNGQQSGEGVAVPGTVDGDSSVPVRQSSYGPVLDDVEYPEQENWSMGFNKCA